MPQEEINNIVLLAQEERDLMREHAYAAMKQGVKIRDPDRFDLRGELICGMNVEIDINVIIKSMMLVWLIIFSFFFKSNKTFLLY